MIQLNKIYKEDCLSERGMPLIDDKSIDLILCDLPYGTTKAKWDSVLPFDQLWKEYERVIKDNGAIILFGVEPFSSYLRLSNLKLYRYDWVWEKDRHANFLFAKKQPLKKHENISIFYKKQPTYNPEMTKGKKNNAMLKKGITEITDFKELMNQNVKIIENSKDGMKFPSTVQYFQCVSRGKNIHPTQKPVELFRYLIRTYTNEGEVVLDNASGSGTTAIACIEENRKYICFENDPIYWESSAERISTL